MAGVKLLLDQNLSHRLCKLLVDVFQDAEQVRHAGLDRASDNEIWQFAGREGFVIVTLDADFADLATLRGAPPKVIWLRCGNQPTGFVERLLRDNAALITSFAEAEDTACLELY
jgi:predicted nuclease of predicted toxin-antitoxin system